MNPQARPPMLNICLVLLMATDTDSATLEQFKSSGKGKFLYCVNYSLRNIATYIILLLLAILHDGLYCFEKTDSPVHGIVGFAAK